MTAGRRKEFERFPAFKDPKAQLLIPDPSLEQTFRSAILDWTCLQWPKHTALLNFYRNLLHIRHTKIVPKICDIISGKGTHQLVDDRCIKVRWPFKNDGALVIVANFSNRCINSESMNNDYDAVFTFPEFSAHDLFAGRLVPWSVLCYLEYHK